MPRSPRGGLPRRDVGVILRPTPRRVAKLQHIIETALQTNELSPHAAGRLAGKLSFLTQAVFGSVGKSAIQPLYARSHDTSSNARESHELSVGVRSALKALHTMLNHVQPLFIPHVVDQRLQAVIFTDAYVRTGEVIHKAGHILLTSNHHVTPEMPMAGATW